MYETATAFLMAKQSFHYPSSYRIFESSQYAVWSIAHKKSHDVF